MRARRGVCWGGEWSSEGGDFGILERMSRHLRFGSRGSCDMYIYGATACKEKKTAISFIDQVREVELLPPVMGLPRKCQARITS